MDTLATEVNQAIADSQDTVEALIMAHMAAKRV